MMISTRSHRRRCRRRLRPLRQRHSFIASPLPAATGERSTMARIVEVRASAHSCPLESKLVRLGPGYIPGWAGR